MWLAHEGVGLAASGECRELGLLPPSSAPNPSLEPRKCLNSWHQNDFPAPPCPLLKDLGLIGVTEIVLNARNPFTAKLGRLASGFVSSAAPSYNTALVLWFGSFPWFVFFYSSFPFSFEAGFRVWNKTSRSWNVLLICLWKLFFTHAFVLGNKLLAMSVLCCNSFAAWNSGPFDR